jgi:hypothetical protein
MTKKYVFFILFSLFLCSSCIKNLDFKQAESLELTPTLVAALVNTNIKQTSMVNSSGVEETEFKDVSRFDVFSTSTFKKVEKIVIDFEVTNPFNRQFTLLLTFFDDNSTITYQFPLLTVTENVVNHKISHEIIIADSPSILNSKNLDTTIQLLPSSDGSIIDINEDKTFKFISSGTFYLKID